MDSMVRCSVHALLIRGPKIFKPQIIKIRAVIFVVNYDLLPHDHA